MTAALRALLAAATPRPWEWFNRHTITCSRPPKPVALVGDNMCQRDAKKGLLVELTPESPNAALIVGAVNALPALLDLWEAARPFGEAFRQRGPVGSPNGMSSYERDLVTALSALSKFDEVTG